MRWSGPAVLKARSLLRPCVAGHAVKRWRILSVFNTFQKTVLLFICSDQYSWNQDKGE